MASGTGIEVDVPRSYRTLEASAARVRSVLVPHLGNLDKIPSIALFENLDNWLVEVDGRRIRLTYEVQDLLPGVEAQARYIKERDRMSIVLSEDTYRGLAREVPHDRFSLAHEIGHAVLHSTELVRMAELPHGVPALLRGEQSNHDSCRDSEWQANAFAAALLMPAIGIAELERRGYTSLSLAVQGTFGVSPKAANIRIKVFQDRRNQLLNL